jgi:phage shock protein A
MALVNRISRLFKADFHAVLDRIEEPEQLLRQAIRDMDEQLAESEQQSKVRAHEQQTLGKRIQELDSKLGETDSELDLCFESGKDDLARDLVCKKLGIQRLLQRARANESAKAEHLADLRQQIDENRSALESLKQKADVFARCEPARANAGYDDGQWTSRDLAISETDIEVALLRERSARRAS